MLIHSALCKGTVMHCRHKPAQHRFVYPLSSVWLDLDELSELNTLPFWSSKKFALIRFLRKDYLNPEQPDLKTAVYDCLRHHQISPLPGRIILLGQLRNWGVCFNPVTFYFCFDQNQRLYAIVAQITNTPWKERHEYVLSVPMNTNEQSADTVPLKFEFKKQFHVSPFMPMEMGYQWHFDINQNQIDIHMTLEQNHKRHFDAHLSLYKEPITHSSARHFAWNFPIQSGRILFSIYWQALCLWLKKTPVYTHPNKEKIDATR